MSPAPDKREKALSEDQVAAYLKAHPEFFLKHPEMLEEIKAPIRDMGDNVEDFHGFALKRLQSQLQQTREEFEQLIDSARDNNSVQQQVQNAIIGLIRAQGLEQLLEVITIDLMRLFDVDVVRLAMESEIMDLYESHYSQENYSGIVFIDMGLVDEIFLSDQDVLLIEDCDVEDFPGFDGVFADCTRLVKSCVLLRLRLEGEPRQVVLSFGVRHKGHFHPGQGVDLLRFMAIILQERLGVCLRDMGEDPMI